MEAVVSPWASGNKHASREEKPARKSLCRLQTSVSLAEEVGPSLGRCEVLQRTLPTEQKGRNSILPRPSRRIMKATNSQLVQQPLKVPKFEFASIPWYTQPACYEQIRATAVDSDSFFSTFEEWLAAALEHERQAERQGVTIIRIRMFQDAFEQWCESSGARNDAVGRSAYAEGRAERLMPLETLNLSECSD
jgi:hypothetical protein